MKKTRCFDIRLQLMIFLAKYVIMITPKHISNRKEINHNVIPEY